MAQGIGREDISIGFWAQGSVANANMLRVEWGRDWGLRFKDFGLYTVAVNVAVIVYAHLYPWRLLCGVCAVLVPSPRQVTRHQLVTPARTLDDTDTDEIVGGEARNSTLPFRALMHVAG